MNQELTRQLIDIGCIVAGVFTPYLPFIFGLGRTQKNKYLTIASQIFFASIFIIASSYFISTIERNEGTYQAAKLGLFVSAFTYIFAIIATRSNKRKDDPTA